VPTLLGRQIIEITESELKARENKLNSKQNGKKASKKDEDK
jgi:hypothetical protein